MSQNGCIIVYLGIVLGVISLKLTSVIDWSWGWVTMPIWAVPVVFLMLMGLALINMIYNGWNDEVEDGSTNQKGN